jgi:hypothetical protein
MSVAHALAGLLVGLWIAWGTHALRCAASLLAPMQRVLRSWPLPVVDPPGRLPLSTTGAPLLVRSQHRTSTVGRRGPPPRATHAFRALSAV